MTFLTTNCAIPILFRIQNTLTKLYFYFCENNCDDFTNFKFKGFVRKRKTWIFQENMSCCLSTSIKLRCIFLPLNHYQCPNIKPRYFKTRSLKTHKPGWETCFKSITEYLNSKNPKNRPQSEKILPSRVSPYTKL